MDIACDTVTTADAAARTFSRLHYLISSWGDAPDQLHHLRDGIERFSSLLETTAQGQSGAHLASVATGPTDSILTRGVIIAERSLDTIQQRCHSSLFDGSFLG